MKISFFLKIENEFGWVSDIVYQYSAAIKSALADIDCGPGIQVIGIGLYFDGRPYDAGGEANQPKYIKSKHVRENREIVHIDRYLNCPVILGCDELDGADEAQVDSLLRSRFLERISNALEYAEHLGVEDFNFALCRELFEKAVASFQVKSSSNREKKNPAARQLRILTEGALNAMLLAVERAENPAEEAGRQLAQLEDLDMASVEAIDGGLEKFRTLLATASKSEAIRDANRVQGENPVSVADDHLAAAVGGLESLKGEVDFRYDLDEPPTKYQQQLNQTMIESIDRVIKQVSTDARIKKILECFRENLLEFDRLGIVDTEDREMVSYYHTKMREILGFDNTEGILADWMDGFLE
jgi:hypothetical protein